MKKTIYLLVLCLFLNGCVTTAVNMLSSNIKVGMTKKQVYDIAGHPVNWTKQVIGGHTYETWTGYFYPATFDFVDGILMGYSCGSIYVSKEGRDVAQNWQ